jgi:predicted nucleic acid-binding protein
MRDVVIDASVVLRWAFDDEDDRGGAVGIVEGLLLGHFRALCPVTFLPEVAGVLVRAVRAERISREEAQAVMAALTQVAIDEADLHGKAGAAMSIALAYGLQVQDATYLETAYRTGAVLVSGDDAQLRAARRLGLTAFALDEVPAPGW